MLINETHLMNHITAKWIFDFTSQNQIKRSLDAPKFNVKIDRNNNSIQKCNNLYIIV